jgi:two-component system, CitB family, sensor kinase
MTLAGQYLGLQLLIVLVVLVGVVAISLAQSAQDFQRTEGREVLSAAESLAANPTVRDQLSGAQPRRGAILPAVAETVRTV